MHAYMLFVMNMYMFYLYCSTVTRGYHKPPMSTGYEATCKIHDMYYPEFIIAIQQNNYYNYKWRIKTSCMLGIVGKEKIAETNLMNRELATSYRLQVSEWHGLSGL